MCFLPALSVGIVPSLINLMKSYRSNKFGESGTNKDISKSKGSGRMAASLGGEGKNDEYGSVNREETI